MGEEEKKGGEEKVEEKKADEEKKIEAAEKKEDEKKVDEAKVAPPPPPPQVIVLRVYMHCEGCARKVRACLKGFPGVEDVETDCKSHTVVVKGEKADPLKVVARVQRKSHRQVQLLSPIPKPPAPEETKTTEEVKEVAKPEEKKEEPQVITVVLKVHMHCEACAQEIKKRMMRMKGVELAEPDLKNSQVTVKGVFEPPKLVEYVYKRTGKHAVVVKQDPEKIEVKEDKKGDEGGDKDKDAKKGEEAGGDGKDKKEGGGEEAAKAETSTAAAEQEDDAQVLDMKKNEFYYYHPQNYQMYPPKFTPAESYSSYSYPPAPQMFSDENPNACSVM